MLNKVADGVLVHESEWCQSNAVVVEGDAGVLLVDPGIHGSELESIGTDVAGRGGAIVAGFATHPHWDHMLWHESFGDAPRFGTATAAAWARERLSGGIDAKRFGIPDDTPLDLMGKLTDLPVGAAEVPWDGPTVRVLEHQAHAPGHAALLVVDARVLVAGDMLSDVFIPMLNLMGADDPIADYLAALDLFEGTAGSVDIVIPGHGSVGGAAELRRRLDQDRAYVEALRAGRTASDARIDSPKPGWEFVREVHDRQVASLSTQGK